MANNYTAVPHAYLDECAELTDAEFGHLLRALLRYSRDGEYMDLQGNERFFARRFMNQEDILNERYEKAVARRLASAKIAAMARWHPEDAEGCERMRTDASDAREDKSRTE